MLVALPSWTIPSPPCWFSVAPSWGTFCTSVDRVYRGHRTVLRTVTTPRSTDLPRCCFYTYTQHMILSYICAA